MLNFQSAFEGQKGHEIGVMDDVGLGAAFDQITLSGVGSDNVTDFGRHTALFGQ